MKKILTSMLMIMILMTGTLLFAAKPLERQGNELAAAGDKLYQSGKYKEAGMKYEAAIGKFKEAMKKDKLPLDSKIDNMLNNTMTCYYKAKEYQKAIDILEKIKTRHPNNHKIIKKIVVIYEKKLHDINKAIDALKRDDPNGKKYYNNKKIGELYVKLKDYKSALPYFVKAKKMKSDAKVIRKIATIYVKLKQPKNAISAYDDFIKTNPKKTQLQKVYSYLGKLYEDLNNKIKARVNYEKSLKIHYDRKIAMKLIQLNFDAKRFAQAKKLISTLLAKNTNDTYALYYRAQIRYKEKDLKGAKADFEKVKNVPAFGSSARQFIKSINSEL